MSLCSVLATPVLGWMCDATLSPWLVSLSGQRSLYTCTVLHNRFSQAPASCWSATPSLGPPPTSAPSIIQTSQLSAALWWPKVRK